MRVLLVSQQFPPGRPLGGIGTQTAAKAAGLAALGHDVVVLTRGPAGGATLRDDGVQVVVLGPGQWQGATTESGWLAHSVAVAGAVGDLQRRTGPFDVVDVPEYGAEGFALALGRDPDHGPRLAVQVHGTTDMLATNLGWPAPGGRTHRMCALMEHETIRAADVVYASSAYSARVVAAATGLRPDAIPVWHCGVDTATFVPSPPDERPTVAFVGRVTGSKGVATLLAAAAAARRDVPGLSVRLIGEVDADGRRLLAVHDPLMLEVRGHQSRDRLPAALAGAWVFAAPSQFEAGPGLVYLEAMSSGLPVVATDTGGVSEVVIDGVTGALVAPEDTEALANVLRGLLREPDRRRALAESARRWVVDHADTATVMPALVEIYGVAT